MTDGDLGRLISKFQLCADGCWRWTAGLNVPAPLGYGRFHLDGKDILAHRVMYELLRGPIPEGMQLDHTCRNRQCVNPDHLEPVTNLENTLRGENFIAQHAQKTHCVNGHLLEGGNLKPHPTGARLCKACCAVRNATWYRKNNPVVHRTRGKEAQVNAE